MRITMSQLKRLIKEALDEAALAPGQVPGLENKDTAALYAQIQTALGDLDPEVASSIPDPKKKQSAAAALKGLQALMAKLGGTPTRESYRR